MGRAKVKFQRSVAEELQLEALTTVSAQRCWSGLTTLITNQVTPSEASARLTPDV